MNNYSSNGVNAQLAEYETPFADVPLQKEESPQNESPELYNVNFLQAFESPFAQTYEASSAAASSSPVAGEYVQFLSELNQNEFSDGLYELAAELEDTWSSKISNETAMGDRFVPFATQQADQYFAPLLKATDSMIDRVAQQFSGNNLADRSDTETERFFAELEFDHAPLSPAQEQLFGGLFDKVKSVVNKGVELAKKGISVVGKILPINIILDKLKGLVRPLLDKVLKFAIGKLPKNLQPHAQSLAKKFLNLETAFETEPTNGEMSATGELDAIQNELDNHIAHLVFSAGETD
ncbi:MAG: hypothetical protein ICV86_17745, partial [Microcoleus sp. T3-bin5]|nr:hypothetical protein [Microcoleus sp. T3-bin5]